MNLDWEKRYILSWVENKDLEIIDIQKINAKTRKKNHNLHGEASNLKDLDGRAKEKKKRIWEKKIKKKKV